MRDFESQTERVAHGEQGVKESNGIGAARHRDQKTVVGAGLANSLEEVEDAWLEHAISVPWREISLAPSAPVLPKGDSIDGKWWRLRESNPGHADYDSAALTS